MTLNEALKKGKKVRIEFRDDYREIICPIILYQPNKLADVLNSIVGEVYEVNAKDFDYAKILYVSERNFDELVMQLFPQRKGVA